MIILLDVPQRSTKIPKQSIVPVEHIEKKILLIRNQKIILDVDLAERYGVSLRG